MKEISHARAEQLIAKERVEDISQAELELLATHLQECESCTEFARKTAQVLRGLRAAGIELPAGLVSRTQFRVRLRAMELREREPQRRALWVMCGLSWVFGIASAPYVWRLFEWFGRLTGVPRLVLQLGFGLWWTIPALFAVIVLLLENARQTEEPDWMKRGS
jgi:predicted anti-sigma-YlaC factor YlaD